MNKIFLQKWQSQVKKGTLTFIVLNVLKGRELYGYEFIDEVKKQTNCLFQLKSIPLFHFKSIPF